MSNFVIYLELKPVVSQFFKNKYGDPIRFEDRSVGNSRILSVLQPRKKDMPPETAAEGLTALCIPYSKSKDPACFNYVPKRGKKFIVDFMESVFTNCLWNEMRMMCDEDTKLQSAAFAWCEKHGIDLDYADTIRMRYYREKKKFLKRNIDLMSHKRNKKG